ncbi:hypothetical protein PAHAL_5G343100 [Panicum hallii]|uniref:Uncharacterized protein n=1 Tax=Panicum hallii TaxID=206008 RepID=A0A2T8IM96_9POAL|nr:hypothetical protein PAHAL_5G343100 [Panicum hallii]
MEHRNHSRNSIDKYPLLSPISGLVSPNKSLILGTLVLDGKARPCRRPRSAAA